MKKINKNDYKINKKSIKERTNQKIVWKIRKLNIPVFFPEINSHTSVKFFYI